MSFATGIHASQKETTETTGEYEVNVLISFHDSEYERGFQACRPPHLILRGIQTLFGFVFLLKKHALK